MTHPAPIVAIGGTNGKSTTTSLVGALLEAHGLAHVRRGQPRRAARRPRRRALRRRRPRGVELPDGARRRLPPARLRAAQRHRRPPRPLRELRRLRASQGQRLRAADRRATGPSFPPATRPACAQARRGTGAGRDVRPGRGLRRHRRRGRRPRTRRALSRAPTWPSPAGTTRSTSPPPSPACARSASTAATIRRVLRDVPRASRTARRSSPRCAACASTTTRRGPTSAPPSRRSRACARPGPCSSPGGATRAAATGRSSTRSHARAAPRSSSARRPTPSRGRIGDRRARPHARPRWHEAVRAGAALARPGDAVLLSPACSSFDMFRDYKHRGDEFVRAVRALGEGGARREPARTSAAPSACSSRRPSTPSPTPRARRGPVDPVLAAVVVALVGFGVVMVYSASAVQATVQYHDPQFFLKRQVAYAVAGLVRALGREPHRLPPALQAHLPAARRRRAPAAPVRRRLRALRRRRGALALDRPGARAARRDGQGGARHLARVLARQEGRAREDLHRRVPAAPHRGRASSCCSASSSRTSAARSCSSCSRSPCSSSRARRSGTSSARRSSAARFGAAAIRFREYRYERYLAWLHMDQHRQDLAYQPFQSVMSFGSGGPDGPRASGAASRRSTCPRRTPTSSPPSSARSSGSSASRRSARRTCCSSRAACAPRCGRRTTSASFLAFGLSTMFGVQALVNLVGRPGHPADQGPDLAVRQLRRIVAARERRRGRASCSTSRASQASRATRRPPRRRRRREAAAARARPTPSPRARVVSAPDDPHRGRRYGGARLPGASPSPRRSQARRRRRRGLLRHGARRRGARRARRAAGGSSCSTSSR